VVEEAGHLMRPGSKESERRGWGPSVSFKNILLPII
jgi:hypothetical protein